MAAVIQDAIMLFGDSLTERGWQSEGLVQRLAGECPLYAKIGHAFPSHPRGVRKKNGHHQPWIFRLQFCVRNPSIRTGECHLGCHPIYSHNGMISALRRTIKQSESLRESVS